MNPQTALQAYQAGFARAKENQWDAALPHFAKAFAAHSGNLRYTLFLGGALWHTGRNDQAVELWSLGADQDAMIRIAQYQAGADALTRQVSQLADLQIRTYLTRNHNEAIASCAAPGRIASAVWPQTHDGAFAYKDDDVKPFMFYVPDFPPEPIFERETAAWTRKLEPHWTDIRDEFLALSRAGEDGRPYVGAKSGAGPEWATLKGQNKWSSIHLFEYGVPSAAAAQCPKTCAALKGLPLVHHNDNPMEVFFSVLKPGTHIPPHFGLANSRVTVHLPLIIPKDCAIRVGDKTHGWVPGETLLFDDSFNHEAWNKSDETRVVLIFEAWRPDMTDGEIDAVKQSYAARQSWLDNRRVPDLDKLMAS